MNERIGYKELATSLVLKLQRTFNLYPRNICLISGSPRSGTSALCEWLGHQSRISAFPEARILVSAHKFIEECGRFKSLDKDSMRILGLTRHLVLGYYSGSRMLVGYKLLVDKEPLEPIAFPSKDYQQFIANIRKVFPDVKLLFAIRDPMATIWSMSQRTWGESLKEEKSKRFSLEEYIENWCSSAELIMQYHSFPGVYIVQFGRLINDSTGESARILDFLQIRNGIPFSPNKTKEIGFDDKERKKILDKVQPYLDAFKALGISDL